jgi:hypothetical protein
MKTMTVHRHSRFRIIAAATMFAVGLAGVNGCINRSRVENGPIGSPPAYMLGTFVDDYGGHHTISADEWRQGDDRYRIVRWSADARYLIAENSSSGPASLGRWTRIDWMPLDGMPPYTWAFCFSAFQMKTAAAAESSMVASPDTPRSGCNGYPFTRMRPIGKI